MTTTVIGDKKNTTTISYKCMPTQAGGAGYKINDWHDKSIQCMVGTLTTPNQGNLLDWCRMKIKLKKDKDAKFEK